MIDLLTGSLDWIIGAVVAALAVWGLKKRGDYHKARADKAEAYKETSNAVDEADTFTGGDDAREWLSRRGKS